MSNNKLKDRINNAMKKRAHGENEIENNIEESLFGEKINKKFHKHLKAFGVFCIAVFIAALMLTDTVTVNTSDAAKMALENKVSTSLSIGTVILSEDENIGQEDYTISHEFKEDETKIWVWDYAAEDGDYVQVLVNGTPLTEPFMIKNKPKEIKVPATGDIQIKGIRDGGGGITYGVHYEVNNTNYFNTAPEGEFNTYTLVRQ